MPIADLIPLSEIRQLPGNPKDHDAGNISESIRRFGFLERIVINKTTGHLISGHGRVETLRAMKAAGKKKPEGVEGDSAEWMVPVDYVEISADEETAAAIALNKLVESGGWNESELASMLADLAAQGEEMLRGVGFDLDDVDELLRKQDLLDKKDNEQAEEGEPELPEADVLQEKWQVKRGDLWQVSDTFIFCGDATQRSSWMALVEAASIDMIDGVFTSPPYADQRSKKNVPNYIGIPVDEYVGWWNAIQANAQEFLTGRGSFCLNIKPNVVNGERVLYTMDLVLSMVRNWNWHLIDEFCWERVGAPGRWPNRFKNGFEPVYQFAKQTDITFNPDAVAIQGPGERHTAGNKSTGNYYNVDNKTIEWEEALPSNRIPSFGNAIGYGHPAAFPAPLPEFFIKAFSDDGDTWLDPFAGSGTVLVAALRANRRALGIELEPKYVAVTLERIAVLSGDEPKKVV